LIFAFYSLKLTQEITQYNACFQQLLSKEVKAAKSVALRQRAGLKI
jgi:hypothetical protein